MNPGAHAYRHVELPMYEPDTRAKFDRVRQVLEEADYILLSSNRLYRTIPRLPARYPVSTRYYELLFEEALGFERVETFTSYPQLFGWEFVDDAADESFTVYDHPKAIVFAKTHRLSDQEYEALFAEALEIEPQWSYEAQRQAAADGSPQKSLLLEEPVEALPMVPGVAWNSWANTHAIFAVVFWWVVLGAMGLLAWPLTFAVFDRLDDRGYAFAKGMGWLLIGLINWWLASLRLLMNAWPTMLLAALGIGALSLLCWARRRDEMHDFTRRRWRLLLGIEGLFSLAFAAFVIIRILNPDLWQPWFGGEKFMELAFLNAIIRSPYFPPYDPYFAGGYLNYYYYGQYLVSVLVKLVGVRGAIGFNLAIPTFYAMTVAGSFSVAYNLAAKKTRRWVAGALAVVAVAVMGNLTALVQLVQGWLQAGQAATTRWPVIGSLRQLGVGVWATLTGSAETVAFDYWHKATRVIPNTINEFPFFSFLFADLHPHLVNIPFVLLALGLILNLTRQSTSRKKRVGEWILGILALSVALGALGPINTWDLPTYLGLTLLSIGYWHYRRGRTYWPLRALAHFTLVALLSVLLYWPFYQHYQAISVGLGVVENRSPMGPFLIIWGLFLFVLWPFVGIVWATHDARSALLRYGRVVARHVPYLPHILDLEATLVREPSPVYWLGRYLWWGGLVAALILALMGEWVLALLLPLVLWAGLLLFRDDASAKTFVLHLLIFTGMLVLLGCEILYMKDFLGGGDWRRMNTLFKFYTQVWVLLGVALGVVVPRLWRLIKGRWSRGWQWAWRVGFALLVAGSLAYPAMAIPARVEQRFPNDSPPIGTLDGMAYMKEGIYTWPDENHPIVLKHDYDAIRWLQENVAGTPVIAEARLDYYREGGMRVSSFTGLPTLLGAHQGEQRYDWQVGRRDGLTREFFTTPDLDRTQVIAADLGVRYVYVGQLERDLYSEAVLSKFDRLVDLGFAEIVYQNEAVQVYRLLNLAQD
jgi:YYY domain-containing protein